MMCCCSYSGPVGVTYVNVEQICQRQNIFIVYIYVCAIYVYAFIFNADAFLWLIFHGKKESEK